jgi:H+/Cl- antiporter ClcA
VTCYLPQTYGQLLCILPIFGFFTLAMHAGFAIYFPELFPDHLRATGAGLCFNGGRILATPVIWISASLKARTDIDLRLALTMLGSLYLVGLVIVWFLPETKGKDLPTAEEGVEGEMLARAGG